MGLGPIAKVSLAEARKLATRFDADRDTGRDPIELRRAAKADAAEGGAQSFVIHESIPFAPRTRNGGLDADRLIMSPGAQS
jgi:hypothetical protein